MIERSLAYPAHPVVLEEPRERGTCSGCGTITKTLTAPRSNAGARLQGADVLRAVQPSLLHPGRPMVLFGEDGQPIDHPQ